MEEYRLTEAVLEDGPFRLAFRRRVAAVATVATAEAPVEVGEVEPESEPTPVPAPVGTPVASPMNGIFYDAASPGSPPFVKEGDVVTAGQIVGLIEAMKVFNEIPSPVSGTVMRLVAEAGSVVAIGDALLLIG